MVRPRIGLSFSLVIAAACGGPVEPGIHPPANDALALGRGRSECRSDIVVSDEQELRTALSTAPAGSVIGIRGTIVTSAAVAIDRPGLTLTCATQGAALVAGGTFQGELVDPLLLISAARVTVDNLRLDGTLAGSATVFTSDVPSTSRERIRIERNTILCGNGSICVFAGGGQRNGSISQNEILSDGASAGVLLLGDFANSLPADRMLVDRNQVRETGSPPFSGTGIRLSFVSRAAVTDNTVAGPWRASISVTSVTGSTIAGNELLDSDPRGFGLSQGIGAGVGFRGNTVRDNFFRGGAIGLVEACGNRLIRNRFSGVAVEIVLGPETGANVVVTTNAGGVSNLGARDCNGDGINDPNTIRAVR